MLPRPHLQLLSVLATSLDRKLIRILSNEARLCAAYQGVAPITIEIFLCGLYICYPRKVQKFFKDVKPFEKLKEELCPGTRDSTFLSQVDGLPQNKLLVCDLDSALVKILWNAVRLSLAARRKRAAIPDFISALALEDEIVLKLRRERGLELRGFLQQVAES